MSTAETKLRLTRTLKFINVYDSDGNFAGGGVNMPRHHIKDGLWVQVTDDPVLDRDTTAEVSTGGLQVHLGSTRPALEELALILLAIAHYEPPEPGYSASVELPDRGGNPAVHLVVHLPGDEPGRRSEFAKIHNVFAGTLYDDGTVEDRTLPVVRSGELDESAG